MCSKKKVKRRKKKTLPPQTARLEERLGALREAGYDNKASLQSSKVSGGRGPRARKRFSIGNHGKGKKEIS